ncbi:hypothetical protein CVS47_01313 [Microbacterium lemovicicum]|uniref:Uncharacterized protein n=1 Tax=Microbacterium lemovicicum TaxID=1072463 RepID=A0A3S9W9H4_9MICO|nr:hypothetical protein [Microbacterium lemovicicum]AZS36705.1 hypothetical protein CVS47_01313 [Microbacterium lemovicicum]
MRAFLRRHRVALVCLVVVVPGLVALLIVVPIAERSAIQPRTVEAAAGETATAGGLEFTVRASQEFPGGSGSIVLPPDAALAAAVIDVAPVGGSDSATCVIDLVAPGPEGPIEWPTEYDVAKYGYGRGEGFATGCDPSATAPYSVESVFLTPTGTFRTAAVRITVTEDGLPVEVTLRLSEQDPAQG